MSDSGDVREDGAGTGRPGGERRRGRPTMTDVARLAGVSQSSVSMVLNEMTGSRISAETRARVQDAARQIGYHLPAIRREALSVPQARFTIAYLVDEISTSPHPVVNLDGARDAAFAHGVLVAAHATRSNPALEAATVEAILRDRSVIGVIYSTIFTRRVVLPPALEGLPVVLLNCTTAPKRHLSILPAEVSGGRRAAEHLIGLGHVRIGFINGEPWMDAAADRLDGFRQALAAHGLPFDEALVRNGDWLPASGYAGALDLLRLPKRPTALFCGNDLMAIGAMEAANALGLRVPADVSVLGYDDQELARYSHPPLSSLVLPNYEMGSRAAQALIDMALKGKPSRARTVFVEGPLVPRFSTGPAPEGTGRVSAARGLGGALALAPDPAE